MREEDSRKGESALTSMVCSIASLKKHKEVRQERGNELLQQLAPFLNKKKRTEHMSNQLSLFKERGDDKLTDEKAVISGTADVLGAPNQTMNVSAFESSSLERERLPEISTRKKVAMAAIKEHSPKERRYGAIKEVYQDAFAYKLQKKNSVSGRLGLKLMKAQRHESFQA